MFWQSAILIDQQSANSSLNSTVVKKKDEISQTKGQCRYDLHGGTLMTKFSMGLEILLSRVSYTPQS